MGGEEKSKKARGAAGLAVDCRKEVQRSCVEEEVARENCWRMKSHYNVIGRLIHLRTRALSLMTDSKRSCSLSRQL